MRVLVGTASSALAGEIVRCLDMGKHSVTDVGCIQTALAKVAEEPAFDIILVDLALPELTTLEGLQPLLQHPACGCVVVMGDRPASEIAPKVLAMGARGYLPIYFPPSALAEGIRFLAMKPGPTAP